MTPPDAPAPTRTAGRRRTVLTALVLAGGTLLTTAAPWVTAATRSALDETVTLSVTGADAAPDAAAGALVVAAGALALALAGRWGARVAAVGVALGGVLVVAASAGVVADPSGPARAAALDAVGVGRLTTPAVVTPVAWLASLLGVLAVGLALQAAVAAARWTGAGARHERSGTPAARDGWEPTVGGSRPDRDASRESDPEGDDQDVWDALTRGEDPT